VTLDMARHIRQLYHLGMMQHDIAAHYRINQGRVSEVVNGKRFPE
jgi:predicted XRE-type DNA-binding protein